MKKARGDIWPKRGEKKQQKNYQDEDAKSAINKIFVLKPLHSKQQMINFR